MTGLAELMMTVQVPVPLQAPDQPMKVAPAPGVAVSVTTVPESNAAEQVAPQLIPAGAESTEEVAAPAPVLVTVSVYWSLVKVAVTLTAELMVTVQVPVPEQPPPDQPAKTELASGTAVSVTAEPAA